MEVVSSSHWHGGSVLVGGHGVAGIVLECVEVWVLSCEVFRCGPLLLTQCRVWCVDIWKGLNLGSTPSHSLVLLNLQDATRVDRLNVAPLSLTVLLVLLVDIEKEVLDLVAGSHILRVEA